MNVLAQDADVQKVRLGIKVAPSIIWLKSNTKFVDGNGTKLGFSYGLMFDYNFSRNYALATGIDIAYRGGKVKIDEEYNDTDGSLAAVYSLQYIQLPITLKLKTNEIGYMTYFGQVGFEAGYNIKAKGTDVDNILFSTGKNESIGSQIAPFNLSLLLALGAEYSIGGHASLMVSAYFSNGFLDIISSTNPNFDARSNGVGLNVGIFF